MGSRRAVLAVLAVGVVLGASPAARASHGDDERCRTPDRACVIEAARTYISALASGDADHVRLAPLAWRVNNGHVTVENEQEIRDGIETFECTTVASFDHERWYVDEDQGQGVVFYDLYADATRGENCDPPLLPREAQIPVWLAERFRVLDGLIYDIEVVIWITAPGSQCIVPERRDADFGPAGCGNASRACVIETASAFVEALLSQDASGVQLAPDAWRIENCIPMGDGGDVIRASLESPANARNVAIEDRRWFVDGEHAVIYYTLWTHSSGDPNTPREEWQATYVAQRFRVDDGLIKEIEAVTSLPGDAGAEPSYPDVDGDGHQHIDDNCPDTPNPGQEDQGGLASLDPDGIGDACQCGDVTGDGIVNGQDGVGILRRGLGIEPNPLFAVPGNCDVGGNGICNGRDGYFVTRAALGLETRRLFGQHCPTADPSVPYGNP